MLDDRQAKAQSHSNRSQDDKIAYLPVRGRNREPDLEYISTLGAVVSSQSPDLVKIAAARDIVMIIREGNGESRVENARYLDMIADLLSSVIDPKLKARSSTGT